MSKLLKSLPDMEHSFILDEEGIFTRKRYVGDFTFVIPNIRKRSEADKLRARLDGPNSKHLSEDILQFHYMIAYLRYSMEEAPNWWKEADYGYELYDANIVEQVYKECLAFEKRWSDQVWGQDEEIEEQEELPKTEAKSGRKSKKTSKR